jgi:L-serine dehydratase
MKFTFYTLADLENILKFEAVPIEEYAVKREAFMSGLSGDAVLAELDRRIAVTRDALVKGLESPQHSRSGLTRGSAAAFASSKRFLVQNALFRRTVAYALAVNEVNACGGKIVSFPTAGSSGIVPGAVWAWWDSASGAEKTGAPADKGMPSTIVPPSIPGPPYPPQLRGAFLIAGIAGVLIAQRAPMAGAEGGCQAECGAAGAMAACALAYLEALPLDKCFSAAALSLKNSLGLACDPVAGLVEVPCVKRNAFVAVNALTAVDLTLSGITSMIPFDEVVSAMKQIGDVLPGSLKETAAGGLALTPTGLVYREKLKDQP